MYLKKKELIVGVKGNQSPESARAAEAAKKKSSEPIVTENSSLVQLGQKRNSPTKSIVDLNTEEEEEEGQLRSESKQRREDNDGLVIESTDNISVMQAMPSV